MQNSVQIIRIKYNNLAYNDAVRQAREILDKALMDYDEGKGYLTQCLAYGANTTEGLILSQHDYLLAKLQDAKIRQFGAKQATVLKSIHYLLNNNPKYKSLQKTFHVLPVTTILHPKTAIKELDEYLDDDVSRIENIAENDKRTKIYLWQNQGGMKRQVGQGNINYGDGGAKLHTKKLSDPKAYKAYIRMQERLNSIVNDNVYDPEFHSNNTGSMSHIKSKFHFSSNHKSRGIMPDKEDRRIHSENNFSSKKRKFSPEKNITLEQLALINVHKGYATKNKIGYENILKSLVGKANVYFRNKEQAFDKTTEYIKGMEASGGDELNAREREDAFCKNVIEKVTGGKDPSGVEFDDRICKTMQLYFLCRAGFFSTQDGPVQLKEAFAPQDLPSSLLDC